MKLSYVNRIFVPDWTTFRYEPGTTLYGEKFLSATLEGRLIGYASFVEGNRGINELKFDVITLEHIEVHHDFRRRGIARDIINRIINDYPSSTIILKSSSRIPLGILDAVSDDDVYAFYASLGFVLFYKNYGNEVCTLARPAPKVDLQMMFYCYSETDRCEIEVEIDDMLGCRWDQQERRWINMDRSYDQEIAGVQSNPWEIRTVVKQTPELQRLALQGEPDVIMWITHPDKEVTDEMMDELCYHVETCQCEIQAHSIYKSCPQTEEDNLCC
jgi:GNAT superfamily N-acetyltransferase